MPAALLALALLAGAVAAALVIVRQRRQIRLLEAEARHDPLTGLPNRRGLAAHWAAAGHPRALVLIDLVGFKAVNDAHGHIVGDALLRQVAARLATGLPPGGLVARWGGDEFAGVVAPDALDQALATITRLRATPFDLSASGGPDAVTIGARTGVAEGERALEQAVAVAARRLLAAKVD